jgi:hypothetical protein
VIPPEELLPPEIVVTFKEFPDFSIVQVPPQELVYVAEDTGEYPLFCSWKEWLKEFSGENQSQSHCVHVIHI